ncbi:hypothetical protein AB0C24_29565 [Amycolatopsis japonica]|uniref:hypothetical protein n=1 Tax=Amycolatopsis japonica TaxID=208439 RepID=UPI0033E0489B
MGIRRLEEDFTNREVPSSVMKKLDEFPSCLRGAIDDRNRIALLLVRYPSEAGKSVAAAMAPA